VLNLALDGKNKGQFFIFINKNSFSIVCIFGGLVGIVIRGITLLIKKYDKNKKK